MEHNSVEPSYLVPVSFTGDSFDGESEQLDKEFTDCDDEADMLHNVLEDARAKLVDYRGKMRITLSLLHTIASSQALQPFSAQRTFRPHQR
ncbi:hypothetical protein AHAS_Ahas12G0171800 [Arachis hypogaea]